MGKGGQLITPSRNEAAVHGVEAKEQYSLEAIGDSNQLLIPRRSVVAPITIPPATGSSCTPAVWDTKTPRSDTPSVKSER
jgi:hypothetical protein